ncbi:MAG: DedA family protein [Streptomyces oryziradicis]|nr:DedA family protein [Actinacidiphila oryziradicis]
MIPTGFVDSIGVWAYVLVFVLTMGETSVFIGLVLPGETLVLFAAALAGGGHLNPFGLAFVVVTGAMVGDSVGYWVGRWYVRTPAAERLRQWAGRRRLPGRLRDRFPLRSGNERAHEFLRRHGGSAVFTGRFVGFVRSFLPFAAGAAGMPYRRFLPYTIAASLIWGTGSVAIGYSLGASAGALLDNAGMAAVVGVAAVATVAFLAHRFHRRRGQAADFRRARRSVASSVLADEVPGTLQPDPAAVHPGEGAERLPGGP